MLKEAKEQVGRRCSSLLQHRSYSCVECKDAVAAHDECPIETGLDGPTLKQTAEFQMLEHIFYKW